MQVRLFARARDLAGAGLLDVDIPVGATVRELRARLAQQCPRLANLLDRCAVAVDNEFAEDALTLPPEAEIAVLPPVSGG